VLESSGLSGYDVIHVASHAVIYQGAADQTVLLLAGSGDRPVASTEIRKLRLRAGLVFLSCCEAGEGVRQGVGPAHAGLARAFIDAGARRVIAPSAPIEDQAARLLAERFYEHWRAGVSVEVSLRQAQLEIRGGDEGPTAPGDWACYQVITGE
jgi:CHAT domain-containing protein